MCLAVKSPTGNGPYHVEYRSCGAASYGEDSIPSNLIEQNFGSTKYIQWVCRLHSLAFFFGSFLMSITRPARQTRLALRNKVPAASVASTATPTITRTYPSLLMAASSSSSVGTTRAPGPSPSLGIACKYRLHTPYLYGMVDSQYHSMHCVNGLLSISCAIDCKTCHHAVNTIFNIDKSVHMAALLHLSLEYTSKRMVRQLGLEVDDRCNTSSTPRLLSRTNNLLEVCSVVISAS
jgi:hypothetical protein